MHARFHKITVTNAVVINVFVQTSYANFHVHHRKKLTNIYLVKKKKK